MRKPSVCLAFFAILLFFSLQAQERSDTALVIGAGATGGIVSYTSAFSKAPSILARSSIAGSSGVKGMIGESVASKVFLNNMLRESGNWQAISPRVGPQGIDHILLKIDSKTGLPKGLIVGESKYNTSRLGMTEDGLQMSSKWTNRRLEALGNRYTRIATVSNVQQKPLLGAQHELKVTLKSGKEVSFWRSGANAPWKFSGKPSELAEAQKMAKVYGHYLSSAGKGLIPYRSRLFLIKPQGNDIVVTIKDATKLDSLGSMSKLPQTGELVIKDAMKKTLSDDAALDFARKLQKQYPGFSEKECLELAKDISKQAKNIISPYGKLEIAKQFAANAGIASAVAVGIDLAVQTISQIGSPDQIDWSNLAGHTAITGSAVFLGTVGKQYLSLGITKMAAQTGMFTDLSKSLGCSTTLLTSSLSSATGGSIVSAMLAYGYYFAGYSDLDSANRMAIAGATGSALGALAGVGTLAAISAWGTASTGTAIASLSGAAATNASLAFLGGGSIAAGGGGVALGSAILTGGVAVVAIAGTAAVMIVYQCYDEHQETERLLELGRLFTEPDAIDAMMRNNPVY